MKPRLEDFKKAFPTLEAELLREHLERLDDRYFESFDLADIARHVEGLARLSPGNPVELLFQRHADDKLECTVLAFDYAFEFSMITGVLAATGFSISSGDIFTYRLNSVSENTKAVKHRTRKRREVEDRIRRRRIVDRFSGRLLDTSVPFENWKDDFRARMQTVFKLLESRSEDALNEAKQLVNKMVAEQLERLSMDMDPVLYPVTMELDNETGAGT